MGELKTMTIFQKKEFINKINYLELLIEFVRNYVEQDFQPSINNNQCLELVNDEFLMNHCLKFENL
jgi:hypothetical protein